MNGTLGGRRKHRGVGDVARQGDAPGKVGNYMGQNDGRITHVTETKISMTELVSDGQGGWIERPASIALTTMIGGVAR